MKHHYVFWEQLQKLIVRLEAHFSYRLLHTYFSQVIAGKKAKLKNR